MKRIGSINVISKLKHNYWIRAAAMPVYFLSKKAEIFFYRYTEDSAFVRNLKDSCPGGRCFIVGNGPSLRVEDLERLKSEICFASNRIYALYDKTDWRPDYYLSIDKRIIRMEAETMAELKDSVKFIANAGGIKNMDSRHGVHRLVMKENCVVRKENFRQKSVAEDVSRYVSNTLSVTCTAMEMAIYMGFREIYLLGIDHTFSVEINRDGSKTLNPGVKNRFEGAENKKDCLNWAYIEASTGCYQVYKDYADRHGIKIMNATRGGKLEVFERKNLDEILQQIENGGTNEKAPS